MNSVCFAAILVLLMSITKEDEVDSDDRIKAIGWSCKTSIAGTVNRASNIGLFPPSYTVLEKNIIQSKCQLNLKKINLFFFWLYTLNTTIL